MSTTTTLAPPAWTPEQVPVTLVTDLATARTELACLRQAKAISIDTETVIERDTDGNIIPRDLDVDGPGAWRVMSIAARFADGDVRAWVLDVGYINTGELTGTVPAGHRPFAWNAPFDDGVLARGGITVRRWWDGMLAAATLNQGASGGESKKHMSLAEASRKYLGYDLEGKSGTRLNYQTVTDSPHLSDDEVKYAAIDAIVTLEVCRVLGALLREADLVPTFVNECDGQPFVHKMTVHGMPMNAPGYSGEIDKARTAANAASERIAVATTGKEMLSTLVKWAVRAGKVTEPTQDALVEVGLNLLHDVTVMTQFITAVRAQVDQCHAQLGELTGAGAPMDDLFSDGTFIKLPFDPDNDTETRRWLSKVAPHFVADYVVAAREGKQPGFADSIPTVELIEAAGTKRKLTKDHDLEVVLGMLRTAGAPDVTDQLRQLSLVLLSYRRYRRILVEYGDVTESVLLKPDWNHNSGVQVAAMLNQYSADHVRAYMREHKGEDRLLGKNDAVDKDALKLIGGELSSALLEFRKHEKIVSTYGDDLLRRIHAGTGRIHARYSQCLTGTGRLNSYRPNAQNLAPLSKPFFQPPLVDGRVRRVLVAVDLSQAELRFVADQAQDEAMLAAFRAGEDLHERTATLMFGIDMKALKDNGDKTVGELAAFVKGLDQFAAADPGMLGKALYKIQRTKAKSVAFGYAYGLKGASLANQLTVNGVPTTKEEADELLRKFDEAYPQVAAWMAKRVAFIASLSDGMRNLSADSGCDFVASWRLHLAHAKVHAAFRKLAKDLGRTPTAAEVAAAMTSAEELADKLAERLGRDPEPAELAEETARREAMVTWTLGYDHSVVLRSDGQPWSFESRTVAGRRRLFPVRTSDWVLAVVTQIARSRKPATQAVRDEWVEQWNAAVEVEHAAKVAAGKARGPAKTVTLTKTESRSSRTVALDGRELEKVFEDRDMRNHFVAFAQSRLAPATIDAVFRYAMADRIRAMGNQYRNHPIQGGVADAVMVAFGRIDADLTVSFPTAAGIQSVHDSIVIECDIEDAIAVRDMVVKHMQDALADYCPTVPCVADGDIQLSLDDKTSLSAEEVAQLASAWALAA